MGEKGKPKPIVLVSKKDGRVIERFHSITEAAESLQLGNSEITRRARDKTLSERFMVRFESEWNGYERFKPRAYNRPIIAVYWNIVSWFPNATEAGKRLGFCGTMVSQYANSGKLLPGGIFVKYQEDTKEFAEMSELIAKKKELECLSTK